MKKKLIAMTMGAVLLAGIVAIYQSPIPVHAEVVTNLDKKELDSVGITLDVPDKKPVIDKTTAIENAKTTFGDLANGSSDVQVEYQLVTNPRFQGFSQTALDKNPALKIKGQMEKTPVYIVTFNGVSAPVFGRHDDDRPRIHHVVHVVVDATTGESLMAFSGK